MIFQVWITDFDLEVFPEVLFVVMDIHATAFKKKPKLSPAFMF